ncbi:Uncharacterised protein [Streptococcus pneumoniae]|nr:Uncharacterised protein [Streptococcus pneumoniae]
MERKKLNIWTASSFLPILSFSFILSLPCSSKHLYMKDNSH